MRPTPARLAQLRQQAATSYQRDGQPYPAIIRQLIEAEQAHTASHQPDAASRKGEAA